MLGAFSIYVVVVVRDLFGWCLNAYVVIHLSAIRTGLFRYGGRQQRGNRSLPHVGRHRGCQRTNNSFFQSRLVGLHFLRGCCQCSKQHWWYKCLVFSSVASNRLLLCQADFLVSPWDIRLSSIFRVPPIWALPALFAFVPSLHPLRLFLLWCALFLLQSKVAWLNKTRRPCPVAYFYTA